MRYYIIIHENNKIVDILSAKSIKKLVKKFVRSEHYDKVGSKDLGFPMSYALHNLTYDQFLDEHEK